MHSTKIIQILTSLSPDERKEFGKFIRSPFHNNRKDVIRFYDALGKYSPDYIIDKRAKEEIFKSLYPAKKYDPEVIVLLSSFLFGLCKEFITISAFRKDQITYRDFFLKSLDTRYADNLFELEYRSAHQKTVNEKLNENHYGQISRLEEININFNLRRNRQDKVISNTVRHGDLSLQGFLVKIVIMHHDMLANKSAFNYEFADSAMDLFFRNFNFDKFMSEVKIEDSALRDYLFYYYYLHQAFKYPKIDEHYLKLKENSFRNFDQLDKEEKSTRFLYLIHYCIYQLEEGNLKFLRESFNVYTEALERKLYQFDSRDMGLMFFRNFVLVGLAAKEFDRVENFITEYSSELKEDYKDEVLKLCRSMLHFEKKEYGIALDYLSKMNNSYSAFRLGTKHLYLKIYFEANQFTSFFSLLDAYKHYLKNDKTIPQRIKELHNNFLNYAGKLAKIKSSGKRAELLLLKNEIRKNSDLDFRHRLWLTEKASELEN